MMTGDKMAEERKRERPANGNIILIGMPASGKSTVGVILAKILGMDFIDTDIVIQQREKRRLSQIIREQGVDVFLAKEEAALLSISVHNTVVATGGSAVYSCAAMEHLSRDATVIYLEVRKEDLIMRLRDINERGVVLRNGESFSEMYDARSGLYAKYADITVPENGYTIEDTVQSIYARLIQH